jgi:hypothetical protein
MFIFEDVFWDIIVLDFLVPALEGLLDFIIRSYFISLGIQLNHSNNIIQSSIP